jgi:hypothetical protein
MLTRLKGWRTHIWNITMGLVNAAVVVSTTLQGSITLIEEKWRFLALGAMLVIQTVGNLILREFTDTPARNKRNGNQ